MTAVTPMGATTTPESASGIPRAAGIRRALDIDPGRPFVSLAIDYLMIGGLFSLAVLAYLAVRPSASARVWVVGNLWTLILLSNSAHFAGSTVRLYSKPGSFRDLPFLTMGLPLATLAALTLGIGLPGILGCHIQSLYLTWSPYHYSAQAYGLAVMYCYRSSAAWNDTDKRLIRLACFLPFLHTFVNPEGPGLDWLLSSAILRAPGVHLARVLAMSALTILSFLLPPALFIRHQIGAGPRMPLISLVLILTNAVWLVGVGYGSGLSIALVTVFHGIQYLAILTIFHVRERLRRPENARPWWQHATAFYAVCLAGGYLIFQAWPEAYVLLGFGYAESVLVVVAVINIHHFIVDAFIWRLRKDPNYAVVAQGIAP